jgi:hypothetical protein
MEGLLRTWKGSCFPAPCSQDMTFSLLLRSRPPLSAHVTVSHESLEGQANITGARDRGDLRSNGEHE